MPRYPLATASASDLLPAPGLDHDVLRQVGLQDFVPADHDLAVLLQQLLHALVEVRLQPVRCLQVVLLANAWMRADCVPLLAVDFVAADVEVRVGEERRHLADEARRGIA